MADLRQQLQKEGWFLSDEGLKQLTEDGKITNLKIIVKKALDVDLREVAAPGFPEEVGRCKVEGIPGGLVLQIQKVRNVSAPKANEESQAAPRMLKITLTDGHSTCHAIEIQRIPALTINTPPGTKILLKSNSGEENIPVCSNFLLLNSDRAEVLGGHVTHMIEKWEINRNLAKQRRFVGEDGGPPAWIPFGQKIVRLNPLDKNFKSIQEKDKQNTENLNPEFEDQRKNAIAEAGKAVAKKVFGGGNRQLLDHNVQQIVEFGFSIEQADNALKMNRNNVDRALKSLQRQTEIPKGNEGKRLDKEAELRSRENPREGGRDAGRGPGKGNNREGGKGRTHDDEVGPSAPAKPTGRLSLFDFLEDKLPFEEKEKLQASSFRTNQDRGGRGGGRGTNGRGSSYQDRDTRGGHSERVGRGGRGRGGIGSAGGADRRPERQPRDSRDDNRSKDENRFKDRKGTQRGRDQSDSNKGKKDGPSNGRGSSKNKGQADNKAPRFQNQKPNLQHESTRYLGHTPSNAVSSNSDLGQGTPDWGTSLVRKVEMMSMIDCDNTPDDDVAFSNPSWNNSQRNSQQQQTARQNDSGRNADQGLQNPKPNHPNFKHNDYRNNSFDNDAYDSKGPAGPPGVPRNAFSNQSMPKIPDFPFKDNIHIANPMMNGGYSSSSTANLGNSRNSGNSRNFESIRNMPGGRSDNPHNNVPEDCDGPGVYWSWKLGDVCLARYWEDERYYEAIVTGIAARTLVVRFTDYGNHEEVLKQDTIPVTKPSFTEPLKNALNSGCLPSSLPAEIYFNTADGHYSNPGHQTRCVKPTNSMNHNSYESNGMPFSGSVEFRRGGTRAYVKQSPPSNMVPEGQGHNQGYNQGYNQGHNQGYNQGHNQGYNQGHNQGYNQGHNQGYNEGQNQGHNQGHSQGQGRRPARAPQSMYVPPAQRK